jgi:hypothetical protein
MRSNRALCPAIGFVAVAILSPLAVAAPGVTPTVVSGYPIVANPEFGRTPNTMMYTVTVRVSDTYDDEAHTAVVGFTDIAPRRAGACSSGPFQFSQPQVFNTDTRTWTLYNFQPGTPYYYKVRIGAPGSYRVYCGELATAETPVPTIPDDLDALDIQVTRAPGATVHTKYVLMDTDDCGGRRALGYLLVVDTSTGEIVWYLDVDAAASDIAGSARLSGWRYQPGPTATSGRIHAIIGKKRVAEFGFDGAQISAYDSEGCDGSGSGPCFHHDVWKSDATEKTYVLTTLQNLDTSTTGTSWDGFDCSTSLFNDDGFAVLSGSGSYTIASDRYLMQDFDYDPETDGGPHEGTVGCSSPTWDTNFVYDAIDWTHVNSVSASTSFGGYEVVDVSLKEWDQVVRINPSTNDLVWRLSPHESYSDMDIVTAPGVAGAASFGDQHDAHSDGAGHLLMFDNTGDTGSRVLRFSFTGGTGRAPPTTATIDRSWIMTDADGNPLSCPIEGSGEIVPGTGGQRVLALCNADYTIAELSDPDGDVDDDDDGVPDDVPALVVSLPQFGYCPGGVNRDSIGGWFRAFPLESVGEF